MWLKNIAYERLPGSGKLIGVFALSAFWHGFAPGYYLGFSSSVLLVFLGRAVNYFYLLVKTKSF